MVIVFSHWEGTHNELNWMQHGRCHGTCQNSATQQYSNLEITTYGSTPPDPTPDAGFTPLTIIEDDVEKTLYVQYENLSEQYPAWSEAQISGSELTYGYKNRMYLSESPSLDNS
jgi:hypothetical protein